MKKARHRYTFRGYFDERRCQSCGEWFAPSSHNQKICLSAACHRAYVREYAKTRYAKMSPEDRERVKKQAAEWRWNNLGRAAEKQKEWKLKNSERVRTLSLKHKTLAKARYLKERAILKAYYEKINQVKEENLNDAP